MHGRGCAWESVDADPLLFVFGARAKQDHDACWGLLSFLAKKCPNDRRKFRNVIVCVCRSLNIAVGCIVFQSK